MSQKPKFTFKASTQQSESPTINETPTAAPSLPPGLSIPQNPEQFKIPVQPDTFKRKRRDEDDNEGAEFLPKHMVPSFLRAASEQDASAQDSTVHDVFKRPEPTDESESEHGWINPALFAQAMLKGMGLSKELAKKKHFPEPIVPKPRVKLAGLGADQKLKEEDPAAASMNTISQEKFLLNREANKREQSLNVLSKYDLVLIKGGPYDGLLASVEDSIPDARGRLRVKLNLPNRLVTDVKQDYLSRLNISALPANHEARDFARSLHVPKDTPLEDQGASVAVETTNTTTITTTILQTRTSLSEPPKKKRRTISWIIPSIQVRMISKTFQQGKYYCQKALVMDVPDMHTCTLRFENGAVFNDVPEKYLETVIPRKEHSQLVCVRGKYKGFRGEMIAKNNKKQTVTLQKKHDDMDWSNDNFEEEIVELSFDDVCHFIGGA